jgi:hypothetical protein
MTRLNQHHHNSAAMLDREKARRLGDFEATAGRNLARLVKQSTPVEMPASINW